MKKNKQDNLNYEDCYLTEEQYYQLHTRLIRICVEYNKLYDEYNKLYDEYCTLYDKYEKYCNLKYEKCCHHTRCNTTIEKFPNTYDGVARFDADLDAAYSKKDDLLRHYYEPLKKECDRLRELDMTINEEQTEEQSNCECDTTDEEQAEEAETDECEALKQQLAEANDKYLRLAAEFDNFRKRTLKEKADLILNGGEKVLVSILPVIDNLERALSTMETASADIKPVKEGVELIHQQILKVLATHGVSQMEPIGEPLNTDYHEAIAMLPAADEEAKGKIIDCVEKGYTMGEKVIRHAKVAVAQ